MKNLKCSSHLTLVKSTIDERGRMPGVASKCPCAGLAAKDRWEPGTQAARRAVTECGFPCLTPKEMICG